VAFPYWIARVNRRVTNRILARFVGRIPHLALLHHQGWRSGTPYRVPIMAFPLADTVAIALTYGPEVDWLKNVMEAGGCTGSAAGREWRLTAPRIVCGADLPHPLSGPFRVFLRVLRVDTYVLLAVRP
jgi:deazaflavin-dependent oxidoreductase (nitroreductase family)